jgi:hypothetical protein
MHYTDSTEYTEGVNQLHQKHNLNRKYTAEEFEAIVKQVTDDPAVLDGVGHRRTRTLMEALDRMCSPQYSGDAILEIEDLPAEQAAIKQRMIVGKFIGELFNRVEKTNPMGVGGEL